MLIRAFPSGELGKLDSSTAQIGPAAADVGVPAGAAAVGAVVAGDAAAAGGALVGDVAGGWAPRLTSCAEVLAAFVPPPESESTVAAPTIPTTSSTAAVPNKTQRTGPAGG